MNPEYFAVTARDVRIPKAFANRSDALRWADERGDDFPGCRIVMRTKTGNRVIWKHVESVAA